MINLVRKILNYFGLIKSVKPVINFYSPIQGWHHFAEYNYKKSVNFTFNYDARPIFNTDIYINKSITGWPAIGKYCGLVIDESVATDEDWKLYLPMVESQVGHMEPINDFGDVVKF